MMTVKIIFLVIDRVVERDLNKFQLGEYLFHLWPDKFIEAIIIVDMKEPATNEIVPQVGGFLAGKYNIAMTRKVEERIINNVLVAHFHCGIIGVYVGAKLAIAEFNKVGKGGGIGIPVATAIIFYQGDPGA